MQVSFIILHVQRFYYTVFKITCVLQMDYTGKSFKSEWIDNILFLEINAYDDDLFGLLGIILDAAEKQGSYSILWDFRMMDHPGYTKIPKIIYNATKIYSSIKNVERASVLVVDKYYNLTNTIIKSINFNDTSYVGCNPIEARQFLS